MLREVLLRARTTVLLLVAAACFIVSACGGASDETAADAVPETTAAVSDGGPPPETETPAITRAARPKPRRAAPRFTGVHESNYEIAYQVCGAFSLRKLASDLGISSTSPVAIAEAYAADYRPAFRQAPYAGCLAVLLGRPSEVE